MKILVSGGAGFIGSALIRHLMNETSHSVVNVDKLSYAGCMSLPSDGKHLARYVHECIDICDRAALERAFEFYQPDAVMHLAAETHVDRSIDGPLAFVHTNVMGTATILEVARAYWAGLEAGRRDRFRFHHISTDEVFGDLGTSGTSRFVESSSYAPSSPYAASKAGSDHLVRAWQRTYGLPTLISNCSNNYGPGQFPEKLIPLTILSALQGLPLPVYGDGQQIRDWLYVEDHARALLTILTQGRIGETYNVGADNQQTNLMVVRKICALLEQLAPEKPAGVVQYTDLIEFVIDRPGHDSRYAIDAGKLQRELGWQPLESFESGLRRTVEWYIGNQRHGSESEPEFYPMERLGVLS